MKKSLNSWKEGSSGEETLHIGWRKEEGWEGSGHRGRKLTIES